MACQAIFYLFMLGTCSFANSLELKQVLILSRHNVRTPFADNLQSLSPNVWPKWEDAPGELTKKGALLEGYHGQYFSQWLDQQQLIPEGCPEQNSVFVHTNTIQRTKDTAMAFLDAAFHNCSIPVDYENILEMDPIFYPDAHNTEAVKQQIISEISKKLNETDLKDVYLELNRIANLKDSQICKEQSYCDLVNDTGDIVYKVGEEPVISGPLYIAFSMVDAFLMGYYEGLPEEDIAWGEIKTDEQWNLLIKAVNARQDIRFNLPKSSKELAKPLVQYIKEMLSSNKTLTLLVGHDFNLHSVIAALGFKLFKLPGQLENSPIGAKLVFQRWSDGVNDFLRVEYVYQSLPQIRNAQQLSLLNPPKNITMHFNNLSDEDGFYRWSEFESILRDVTE
ncbi:Glucose-1-phosphatase [Operophtera brumata]|uniref:Glucose-1-phosphatase n=1 Tax=Operophtera brumata TaxID=104452 RepID=A0A0L7K2Z5_OPEBR|nr:Glucose-1-phosphatase [Operophtera brumata]